VIAISTSNGHSVGVATIIGGMALTLILLLAMIGYYFYKVDQYSEQSPHSKIALPISRPR